MSQFASRPAGQFILRTFGVATVGGYPPRPGDLLEIGWCDSVGVGDRFVILPPTSMLVSTDRPVSADGFSIHHVLRGELDHSALARDIALAYVTSLPRASVFAAHNAARARAVLPELASEDWVCTFKTGVFLFPDAERHTDQYLRHYLDLPLGRPAAQVPHQAAVDAWTAAHLFTRYLQSAEMATLLKISAEPVVLPRVTFGEHRGKKWSDPEVPASLLSSVLGNENFSIEVHMACRRELDRRAGQSFAPASSLALR